MTTDFQRSKVYNAEFTFRDLLKRAADSPQIEMAGSTFVLPPEALFSSPETVQAYVDRVLVHPAVVERWGRSKISVRKRKGTTKAHYQRRDQTIAVPDSQWALREVVVLHEIAHHFSAFGPSHGPQFVDTLLGLVGAIMGPQAQLVLRILYSEEGVKVA